ncbi:gamma-aminobutyric acid receptor subunit rho-2-like [Panulirus ornatus]|uniref:gamma-aminobutyric acid receptor subunit rho-2-like n=1 Tax=Panulirus ornatus TaxID=150431 RepID=UPI003A866E12
MYPRKDQLILQSDDGDVILKSSCPSSLGECLIHQHMGESVGYSVIHEGHVILGRKLWREFEEGTEYMATLSTCADDSFTCNDSRCIELSSRCDGQPQCFDGSDEGNSCFPMEAHASYRPMECPTLHPQVTLHVHLHGVSDIALEKNEFTATLSIGVSWTDHRLAFSNLNNYTRKIQVGEFRPLWTPELLFTNARYEDNLHIQTKTGVLEEYTVRAVNPGRPDVRQSYEVRSYSGSEVRNTRRIQYLFTFSCEYDLFAFPFDIQECDMILQLVRSPGCEPQWDVQNNGIHTTGTESTVSMYDISRLRYSYNASKPHTVRFKLLFYRRYEAYLLTTFGPCVILYMLSKLTLTRFQIAGFTDRITVSLSLLIVIASLFSQVSSTLPTSPAPKFVDWFFFYCICRVSFVFFLHTIIDERRRLLEENKPVNIPSTNAGDKLAWEAKPSHYYCRWWTRLNEPGFVKHVGIITITICDVVSLCLFTVWIILDQNDKTRRFHRLNITQGH